MKLTREELAALPEKTKKHPRVVQLYLDHDFATAYAMHTDMRVAEDGYRAAVGAVDDWERHGLLQFEFLKAQGLRPEHALLEVGCGTGRLARKAVPYLKPLKYVGVDLSRGALAAARELARDEGWDSRIPIFCDDIEKLTASFDFAWAFSVFIHVPTLLMRRTMREVSLRLAPGGRFFFSYVPEKRDERTGLKQFRHTEAGYAAAASWAGLSFERAEGWTGEQRIAIARRR
jgi:SAM-dependent methyltransferase